MCAFHVARSIEGASARVGARLGGWAGGGLGLYRARARTSGNWFLYRTVDSYFEACLLGWGNSERGEVKFMGNSN